MIKWVGRVGGMFGRGVYFADSVTKSALHSGYEKKKYMALCEVALGKPHEEHAAQYHLKQPPQGYHSIKGVGQYQPGPEILTL